MRAGRLATILLVSLVAAGCKDDGKGAEKPPVNPPIVVPPTGDGYVTKSDFEYYTIKFLPKNGVAYSVVDNPFQTGINASVHCGKVVSAGGNNEFIYCEPLGRTFDFTKTPAIFKMKVYAPGAGLQVSMKIEPKGSLTGITPPRCDVKTTKAGEWEELTFNFTSFKPESNVYQKIVLYFNFKKGVSGQTWYFDDIRVPDDDLTSLCLFKRYAGNPIIDRAGSDNWRDSHMANASVMTPDKSPDGKWRVYLRGSGNKPYYCDQIGLLTQEVSTFKPFGPWKEYHGNPVLPVGAKDSFDGGFLLGTAAVTGADNVVYVYYNGCAYERASHGVCVRYSTDGGYTFKGLDHRLYENHGCSDAVYHDGKYYVFHGGGNPCELYVTVTTDPLSFDQSVATTYKTIPVGGGPSNFDSMAVNGSLVFRISGVDKWFCTFQGSSSKYDFPDRFHIATSDDLIHWTKVRNDQPLFTRGSMGQWDQGGIWFGEIFEYGDNLYLYYEGWGCKGLVPDRDEQYFSGGHSAVGCAFCSKADFLKWCGI